MKQENTEKPDLTEVTLPYPPEKALKNGDIVLVNEAYQNMERFHTFLQNYKEKTPDTVRIAKYNDRGEPTFSILTYDGEVLHFTYDNSLDFYSGYMMYKDTTCQGMFVKTAPDGTEHYFLNQCGSGVSGDYFYMPKIDP